MKYILILGLLNFFSGTNLIAQSNLDSHKPIIKMTKQALYKAENGLLKDRDSVLIFNIDTYTLYDKNEKDIEKGRYNPDNGSLYEKTIYERNEKGDVIKAMKLKSSNDVKSYWTCKYDSDNNMIEVKTYNSENKLTRIQSNKYDKNGNNIEVLSKSPEGENGWRYVYKYNFDNKKNEEFRYKPDGSLKDRRTYSYNKKGNEFEQFNFNPDGSYTKFESEYDEMDNLTVQNWFNEEGEQTHQTSFEYVYDSNGNWITKKRSSNGILSMIWERQIEYY